MAAIMIHNRIMAKGRPVKEIKLTKNERNKLELMASRPKSTQRDAERARIVLACSEGLANKEVATRLGICVQTVGKWRTRFAEARVEGLTDAPRPGAPRRISDKKVEQVVTETLEQKPKARTHWSSRLMAKQAAYDVATGRVLGKSHARHRSQEFLKFLKEIDLAWPDDGNELHVVMDNYATHKTEKVQQWLDRRPRFKIHFTPTGASWINLVGRFFGKITSEAIRRGSFASTKQLKAAMDDYIQMHNEGPVPFKWTATADLIFEKMESSLT